MSPVLYVNQSGVMSGAEHSLLGLLGGLPRTTIAGVACPAGGLAEAVDRLELPRWEISGTDVSFRLHPRHTARGVARLAEDARRLRAVVRESGADVVHANTTRAGLAASLSGLAGGPPMVVHVRDWFPSGSFAHMTLSGVQRRAAAIIANSHHIERSLPAARGGAKVHVVYNAVDTGLFDPARIDRTAARRRLGVEGGVPVLAVVGQLTPWKGQDDAVRVAAILRRRFPGLRLLIAGSAKFVDPGTRFDNRAYDRDLRELVEALGLDDTISFLGEREDVPEVLAATDVLLVPSWQEAFGRVAIEAMAMRVPVVTTSQGGPAEVVRDGEDGVVLDPRRPHLWATRVARLLEAPELRREMGENGRRRAVTEFGIASHVERVMSIHDSVRR